MLPNKINLAPWVFKMGNISGSEQPISQSLIGHIAIASIHSIGFEAKREPAMDKIGATPTQINVTTQNNLQVGISHSPTAIIATASLKTIGTLNDETLFSITNNYRVIYPLTDVDTQEAGFQEKAIDFCARSTLVHVWPYWREFQCSATLGLGMPPMVAGLIFPSATPGQQATIQQAEGQMVTGEKPANDSGKIPKKNTATKKRKEVAVSDLSQTKKPQKTS
jgi:hypothetical protein